MTKDKFIDMMLKACQADETTSEEDKRQLAEQAAMYMFDENGQIDFAKCLQVHLYFCFSK